MFQMLLIRNHTFSITECMSTICTILFGGDFVSKIIGQTKKNILKDNYHTPSVLYNYFKDIGSYDPCPYDDNFIINGLTTDWGSSSAFVNPPFSNIKPFVKKAIEEIKFGNLKSCVFLVPCSMGTKWMKLLLDNCYMFIFFNERLKFNDGKFGATFDTCLIFLNRDSIDNKSVFRYMQSLSLNETLHFLKNDYMFLSNSLNMF